MQTSKLAPKIICVGVFLNLVLQLNSFISRSGTYKSVSDMYIIVGEIFGYWLSPLVFSAESWLGHEIPFQWKSLLYIPDSALWLCVLLVVGIRILKRPIGVGLVYFLTIAGVWMLLLLLPVFYNVFFKPYGLSDNIVTAFLQIFYFVARLLVVVGIISALISLTGSHKVKGAKNASVKLREKLTPAQMLFSFSGRINRARFWLYQIVFLNVVVILFCVIGGLLSEGEEEGVLAGYIFGLIVILWPTIALGVKRCHDRNRSGAFMLISLIPILNFWYVIEAFFLKGTEGENQYGADPLG